MSLSRRPPPSMPPPALPATTTGGVAADRRLSELQERTAAIDQTEESIRGGWCSNQSATAVVLEVVSTHLWVVRALQANEISLPTSVSNAAGVPFGACSPLLLSAISTAPLLVPPPPERAAGLDVDDFVDVDNPSGKALGVLIHRHSSTIRTVGATTVGVMLATQLSAGARIQAQSNGHHRPVPTAHRPSDTPGGSSGPLL